MPNKIKSDGEAGYVLLTVIMLLALTTVVVFSAMHTSAVELQISANDLLHQTCFHLAEAGIAHGIKTLEPLFVQKNQLNDHTGPIPVWNFAFNGPDQIAGTSHNAGGQHQQPGSDERGSLWLDVRRPDGSWYTVTVVNNDETGAQAGDNTDRDGLIWLRSDAGGPRGGRVSIQVLLQGVDAGGSGPAYPAQAGGGVANNYSGSDTDPIIEFDVQLDPATVP